jgi:hypothetical protein
MHYNVLYTIITITVVSGGCFVVVVCRVVECFFFFFFFCLFVFHFSFCRANKISLYVENTIRIVTMVQYPSRARDIIRRARSTGPSEECKTMRAPLQNRTGKALLRRPRAAPPGPLYMCSFGKHRTRRLSPLDRWYNNTATTMNNLQCT